MRAFNAALLSVYVILQSGCSEQSTEKKLSNFVRPDIQVAEKIDKELQCEALRAHSNQKANECLKKLKEKTK